MFAMLPGLVGVCCVPCPVLLQHIRNVDVSLPHVCNVATWSNHSLPAVMLFHAFMSCVPNHFYVVYVFIRILLFQTATKPTRRTSLRSGQQKQVLLPLKHASDISARCPMNPGHLLFEGKLLKHGL